MITASASAHPDIGARTDTHAHPSRGDVVRVRFGRLIGGAADLADFDSDRIESNRVERAKLPSLQAAGCGPYTGIEILLKNIYLESKFRKYIS